MAHVAYLGMPFASLEQKNLTLNRLTGINNQHSQRISQTSHENTTHLDEEAVRVLLLTSPWQPGSKNGEPVRARKTFPITFNLGGSSPPRN
jgi:hypothetical protein